VLFSVELANTSPKGNVLVAMPLYERKTSLYQDLWLAARATPRQQSHKASSADQRLFLCKSFVFNHLDELQSTARLLARVVREGESKPFISGGDRANERCISIHPR
jgi:hypothetical protein